MPLLLWTVSTLASLLLLTGNVCDQAEPSPAIVRIVAQRCEPGNHERSQTGFVVIDPPQLLTPLIATALHGVANCDTITAIAGSTVITDVKVTHIDFQRDVALLAPGTEQQELIASTYLTATHEPIRTDTTGKLEAICAVGYPAGIKDQWPYRALQLQSRTKDKLYKLLPPDQELVAAFNQRQSPSRMINVFRIDGEVAHGVSGAPLLNKAGAVIGMIQGGLKDVDADTVSWAMPWADIEWEAADPEMLSSLAQYDPRLVFAVDFAADTRPDLRILDTGSTNNTYLIEGNSHTQFKLGDDLVVYAEPNPGTEVAIALLEVIRINPTSLTAQVILIDPETEIRTRMRVDDQLTFLSTSQLVPVFDYADGYLLRPSRIRLRPNHELAVGAQLQALEFERIRGEIVDALRTDTMMQITNIGVDGQVAVVKLITGTWPMTGTIVSLAEKPLLILDTTPTSLPTATVTLTITPGYPCHAEIKSDFGFSQIRRVYRNPSNNSPLRPALAVGRTVEIREASKGKPIFYHVWSIEGAKPELGWIAPDDVRLSSSCPQ